VICAVTAVICIAVGSTPSTFDSPEVKASSTPARPEKTVPDGVPSADEEHPTHNPEPDIAASKFCMTALLYFSDGKTSPSCHQLSQGDSTSCQLFSASDEKLLKCFLCVNAS